MGEMRTQLLKWPLAMTSNRISSLRVANRRGSKPATRPEFGRPLLGCDLDVPCRRQRDSLVQSIDPYNLLFDFYCIVADPAPWSNERIDATARSGAEGCSSKPSGLGYLCITFVIYLVISQPKMRTRSARLESRSMLAEFPRATNRSRPFSVI